MFQGLKNRCNAGQSPTVEFLQDLSKHKNANLQILQRAIVSLETSVDDVLPNCLPGCYFFVIVFHFILTRVFFH